MTSLIDYSLIFFLVNEVLVISIHHTPETEQVAFDLINKWLVSDLPNKKMGKYIGLKLQMLDLEH